MRAEGLLSAGQIARHQGDHAAANDYFEEALVIYRELRDARGQALVLALLIS